MESLKNRMNKYLEEFMKKSLDRIPKEAAAAIGNGINERCLSLKRLLDEITGGISGGIS